MNMKRDYIYIAAILLLVLIAGCNACRLSKLKGKAAPKEKLIRTETKRDTVLVHDSFTAVSYVPVAAKKQESKNGTFKVVKDTIYLNNKPLGGDSTLAILNDYYATRFYPDTLRTNYGNIPLSDTITQNKFAGRGWKLDFTIPVVTNTITNTVKVRNKPKRFGIGIQAGYGVGKDLKPQPVISAGLSFNFIRF